MSNFWDKPTEVEHEYVMQLGEGSDLGHIPWFGPNPHAPPIQPPDGLLDDKEYIVFHAFLPTSGLIMEDFFISSFGRFLHKPDNRWYDMSSNLIHQMGVTPTPIVLGRRQWTKDYWRGWAVLEESDVPLRDGGYGPWRNMTPAPLCFINQGWVQLLHFLAYNGRLTGGVFTRRENGSQHGEMFGFIPKLLNLYAQLFPESIITETNNDPDVFFRKKQTNPEVLEILSKMDDDGRRSSGRTADLAAKVSAIEQEAQRAVAMSRSRLKPSVDESGGGGGRGGGRKKKTKKKKTRNVKKSRRGKKIKTRNVKKTKNVKKMKDNTLHYFSADWCGYCQMFNPKWDKIKEGYKNNKNIILKKTVIDDNNQHLLQMYHIQGFPSLILVKSNGVQVKYQSDKRTKKDIGAFLKENRINV